MKFLEETALGYQDVTMVPQYTEIESRKDVDISTQLGPLKLKIPIVGANMDSIMSTEMAMALGTAGALGILHRFQDPDLIISTIKQLRSKNLLAIPSIGIKPDDLEKAHAYIMAGASAICVDIAHAHSKNAINAIRTLVSAHPNTPIVAGNIATSEAAIDLIEAGVKILKVGISNGGACETRIVTGHGIPQITTIMNIVRKVRRHYDPSDIGIIADGGIKNSGDITKALALGADAVMIGSLLAGTDECPFVGGSSKIYRGMASKEAKEDFYGKDPNYVPEGAVFEVEEKGPVINIINQLSGGLKSGCSYAGARNLTELRNNAIFMRTTMAGYLEGTPHFKSSH